MIEVNGSEQVTSWNAAAEASSKVDAIDAVQTPLLKLLAARSRDKTMKALKMALKENHSTELLRVRWENGDRAMLRVQPRGVDEGGRKSQGALLVGMAVPAADAESDHGWEMVRGFLCSAGKQEGVGQLYELDPEGNLIEGVEFQGPIRKSAEKQQLTETLVKPSWRANARAMVNEALEGGFAEPVAATMTVSDDQHAVECREVRINPVSQTISPPRYALTFVECEVTMRAVPRFDMDGFPSGAWVIALPQRQDSLSPRARSPTRFVGAAWIPHFSD